MVIDLKNVQGNILKAFGKPNIRVIFYNITNNEKAKEWLRNLSSELPSTQAVIDAANNDDSKIWIHVSLTASGIIKLGKSLPSSQDNPDPTLDAFKDGMKSRANILSDVNVNGPENWIEPFKNNDDKIDGLVLLAAEQEELVNESKAKLENDADGFGIEILRTEVGQALKNRNGKDIEHFGFRDGVSQPLVEGISPPKKGQTFFPPEEFVLSDQETWINEGSFMVFRRLAQDVPNFKKFMKTMGTKLGMTEDELGAKFVGRWKSGAPLDKFPDSDPNNVTNADENDFKYMDDDPDGKKTPRFSHIRKTNPRGDGVFDNIDDNIKANNTHRMLRRGAPYGKIFDENDPASENLERGLLFMCYVKDIPRQFEFVQQIWADNTRFPKVDANQGNEIEHGHDPIIGQHNGEGFVNLKQGDSFTRIPETGGFEQWVKMTGGEYFFSPSIKALQSL